MADAGRCAAAEACRSSQSGVGCVQSQSTSMPWPLRCQGRYHQTARRSATGEPAATGSLLPTLRCGGADGSARARHEKGAGDVLLAALVFAGSTWTTAAQAQSPADGIAAMPLDIAVEASYLYDPNVTRARDTIDRRSDQAVSLTARTSPALPVTAHTQLLVDGFAGVERFRRYHDLGRVFAGIQADFEYRPSAAFFAPTLALFGRSSVEHYESALRRGYRYAVGVSIRQPVTDRISLFGALAHNERTAKSRVFEGIDNAVRLGIDWTIGPGGTLYFSGEYVRGDTVSTGTATLQNLDIAKVFVLDDAFAPDQLFSYRFEARSVLTTLGYNLPLGPKTAIDVSWRRVQATPVERPDFEGAQSQRYLDNQFNIAFLLRF